MNSHPYRVSAPLCWYWLWLQSCSAPQPPWHPHHVLPKDAKCLPDLLWHQNQNAKNAHKGSGWGRWEVRVSQGCPWRLKSHQPALRAISTFSIFPHPWRVSTAWDSTGAWGVREGRGATGAHSFGSATVRNHSPTQPMFSPTAAFLV